MKGNEELHGISIPSQVMKQIGIDICSLPDVDGYKYLVVCIDYFSKWSEAKPTRDKSATTVGQIFVRTYMPTRLFRNANKRPRAVICQLRFNAVKSAHRC